MSTYTKSTLSGSTNGRGIKVAATATPGTLIHTGSSTDTTIEEIWIYVQNTDTSSRKITLEWGGVTSPDDLIEATIAAESGLVLVVPGLPIAGEATPLVLRAFADSANLLTVHGFVNRIEA